MDIVKVSRKILEYYRPKAPVKPRGSTKAAIRGAVETNAAVLMATHKETQFNYNGLPPNKAISLADVESGVLNPGGTAFGWGMVVDNGAVCTLIDGLLAEIDKGARVKARKAKKAK